MCALLLVCEYYSVFSEIDPLGVVIMGTVKLYLRLLTVWIFIKRERSSCVCACARSVWISAIGAALDYSHIWPPTQNNNKQLSARCSPHPALCRLDDQGSWPRRFGANVHLTFPPRSQIDSTIWAIPPVSRIFDISLSLWFAVFFKITFYYTVQSTEGQVRERRVTRPPERRKITGRRIKVNISLCLLWRIISLRSDWIRMSAGSHKQTRGLNCSLMLTVSVWSQFNNRSKDFWRNFQSTWLRQHFLKTQYMMSQRHRSQESPAEIRHTFSREVANCFCILFFTV